MSDLAVWAVMGLCLIVALYAGWLIVRDRPVNDMMFYGAAVLEVVLVVQAIAGCIALAVTDRDLSGATFVGYLLTAVITPPVAVVWAISEKTRWGTAVVVFAMVTVAALELRLVVLWAGAGV